VFVREKTSFKVRYVSKCFGRTVPCRNNSRLHKLENEMVVQDADKIEFPLTPFPSPFELLKCSSVPQLSRF
jgi:hypothetical protein